MSLCRKTSILRLIGLLRFFHITYSHVKRIGLQRIAEILLKTQSILTASVGVKGLRLISTQVQLIKYIQLTDHQQV